MATYTIQNLRELEDQAPNFGMGEVLEARFAAGALGCERAGLSIQRLAPNARMPFGHKHGEQEEIYVVVDGSGRIKLDDEVVELRRWDAVRIPSETIGTSKRAPTASRSSPSARPRPVPATSTWTQAGGAADGVLTRA